jgi:hypothetical protein
MHTLTRYYRMNVFNFLTSFPPPAEGWFLTLVAAGSTTSTTSASIAEQASAIKKIKEVGVAPWSGVPWGNKSKGASLGRPIVCTGISAKDPQLYHCRSLGWWAGAPNLFQIRTSFGAFSWVIAEHGVAANDEFMYVFLILIV